MQGGNEVTDTLAADGTYYGQVVSTGTFFIIEIIEA